MRVLLVCGSPAEGSHTATLLSEVAKQIQNNGDQVELWDLSVKPLAFSQPNWHKDPTSSGVVAVCDFYGSVQAADAIVLGTPLYHGSYSGVLKNALDCLTGDAFKNKPVGLVSNGSNIRKSHQACLHLTTVVMTMEGIVMHTQIGTGKEDYQQTDAGLVVSNDDIIMRCQKLASELCVWTKRVS